MRKDLLGISDLSREEIYRILETTDAMREIGERYLPSMKINTVFMGDRLGRGGDHTPFQWEGFAAVRVHGGRKAFGLWARAGRLPDVAVDA